MLWTGFWDSEITLLPKIRLLICNTCQTVQELPLFEGDPKRDDTLNFRVAEHRYPDGNEHFGALATVDEETWNGPARPDIQLKLQETFAPGEAAGLGSEFYAVKSTFSEDALKCWQQHNRTENCEDWRSEKKRLDPDTSPERAYLGLTPLHKTKPRTWLCDFCPVTSLYAQRRNREKGLDK